MKSSSFILSSSSTECVKASSDASGHQSGLVALLYCWFLLEPWVFLCLSPSCEVFVLWKHTNPLQAAVSRSVLKWPAVTRDLSGPNSIRDAGHFPSSPSTFRLARLSSSWEIRQTSVLIVLLTASVHPVLRPSSSETSVQLHASDSKRSALDWFQQSLALVGF